MKKQTGFTIIEILIVLAILSAVMAGLYSTYVVLMRQGVKEYHLAESDMELQIAQIMIERDIEMAGYGLVKADPSISNYYNGIAPMSAVDGSPDTITLNGIALGRSSLATPEWSFTTIDSQASTSGFYVPPDPREQLKPNDLIIYYEPNTQQVLNVFPSNNSSTNLPWLFPYPGSGTNPFPSPLESGVLVYGFGNLSTTITSTSPFYTVSYSLGGQKPNFCAPGTSSLLRTESNNSEPLLNCVLDLQVAFGLDQNETGTINCWDNGGVTASSYDALTLRRRLRQVKLYALVQEGNVDSTFTYLPAKVRVGDLSLTACGGGGVGEDVTLNNNQQHYRWRVVSVTITPRNVR